MDGTIDERLHALEVSVRNVSERVQHLEIKILPDMENRFNTIIATLMGKVK